MKAKSGRVVVMAHINSPTPLATLVGDLHCLGQVCLHLWVRVADCRVKLLVTGWVGGEGCGPSIGSCEVVHPWHKILVTYLVDKFIGGYFDIVASLKHVDPVVHIKVSLAFHWDGKFVINLIEENICCLFVRCCNGKVGDLTFEYYPVAVDHTRV